MYIFAPSDLHLLTCWSPRVQTKGDQGLFRRKIEDTFEPLVSVAYQP